MNNPTTLGTAATLGAVAGMRSMAAPAIVSRLLHAGALPVENRQLELLAHPATVATTTLLAIGELVADKLPSTPARTEPGPVAVRMLSGALCGAAISSSKRESVVAGLFVGACAALAATFAAYHVRRWADGQTGLPDAVFAVLEDSLVVATGWNVYQNSRTREQQ